MSIVDPESIPGPRPQDNFAYATIPEWILDSAIGPQAVRLFAVLDRYVGRHENAWPSRKTIAARMNCSPGTVDNALAELTSIGAVQVTHRYRPSDGSQTSSAYTLWPATMGVTPSNPLRHPSQSIGRGLAPGYEAVSNPIEVTPTNNSLLVIDEVDDRQTRFDQQFDELWSVYPRKVGKAAARKAVRVRLGVVAFEELAGATRNYAALRLGQDPAFTMHPATFYGPTERWRDFVDGAPELEVARKARPKSREQVEADVEEAVGFLQRLFDVPRETIERPVTNPIIEQLLTHHPLGAIGRMPSVEVRAMITSAAWDRANPKPR